MEICIKWNICRVCLQEEKKDTKGIASGNSSQMVHLFNEDKKLALHIYELSGVFVKPNDSLPDKICRKCVSVINDAIQFRKTCRSSNTYLQSILERTKSASTLLKPENLISQVSDDEICDDKIEIEASIIDGNELEVENNIKKDKNNGMKNFEEEYSQSMETIKDLEHRKKNVEQCNKDNIPSETVEFEEIIEISEEMFTQRMENETVGFAKVKCTEEVSDSNNYERDLMENSEIDLHSLKVNNEELYNIFKDIKSANTNRRNSGSERNQDNRSVEDEDMEYVSIEEGEKEEGDIEESLMMHLEEENDTENQAQVSSTVNTNNEVEYYEHNSNISNVTSDVDEECLGDENFSNSDISSSKQYSAENSETNSHTFKIVTKPPVVKRNSPVIFPRRRMPRHFLKSAAYENSRRKGDSKVLVSVCEICGNQFTNRNLMNIHMKVHFQEKNHQCELCFKRFITSCNLQAHMRIHTGEKPYECKYCGRRFNDRSSNLRHERTHTNEKPFECPNCFKSFSLSTTLQNHMKVHTNERSYRCEPCGKSFKLPHHLKTHQNTSLHRSVLQTGVSEN